MIRTAPTPDGARAGAERDEVLAGRAGRGDAGALSLLAVRWHEPLRRFCRRMLGHEDDARDLAQDVLVRAVRGLASYDPGRPFAPWIYRIARNACLNHIEKRRHRGVPVADRDRAGPTPPPDLVVARREEMARVRAAIGMLPAGDRRLLEMKLVRGLDNGEIASALGLSAGALRTRASRAVGRLRELLDAGCEGGRP